MYLVHLILLNTDVAEVEVMLNIRLRYSVRLQPYRNINNICSNSTYIVNIIQRAIVLVHKYIYDVTLSFMGCNQDSCSALLQQTEQRQQQGEKCKGVYREHTITGHQDTKHGSGNSYRLL